MPVYPGALPGTIYSLFILFIFFSFILQKRSGGCSKGAIFALAPTMTYPPWCQYLTAASSRDRGKRVFDTDPLFVKDSLPADESVLDLKSISLISSCVKSRSPRCAGGGISISQPTVTPSPGSENPRPCAWIFPLLFSPFILHGGQLCNFWLHPVRHTRPNYRPDLPPSYKR